VFLVTQGKGDQVAIKDGQSGLVLSAVVCALTAVVPDHAQSGNANPAAVALADFSKRVDEYVALHTRLAEAIGPIEETKKPEDMTQRERAEVNVTRPANL